MPVTDARTGLCNQMFPVLSPSVVGNTHSDVHHAHCYASRESILFHDHKLEGKVVDIGSFSEIKFEGFIEYWRGNFLFDGGFPFFCSFAFVQ